LNSDGQQFHQYQQDEQTPLNTNLEGPVVVCFVDIVGTVDHHCLEVIVCLVDIGGTVDHHCLVFRGDCSSC
jgi:hypothetical protein